jgi:hypothetical protein
MTFPFTALTDVAREGGLVIAVLIGIAFGFVLERAGFGRSTKLAAQFYFRDMTVFKVMFSAIVTAMLGLIIASGFGLANLRDISEHIVSWTYLWPMLVGGFVLGIGFIVSGYCPGTSIVASASGNVDGMFAFGGVVTGTFLYSELLQVPAFHRFHISGEKGAWFLYDLTGIAPQLLAFIVTFAAILAFIGAEKVERMIGGVSGPIVTRRPPRVALAALASLAIVMVATLAIPTQSSASPSRMKTITAAELARAITTEPWRVRIADLRDETAFAKSRVPGSESVKPETLADLVQQTAGSGRALVIVGAIEKPVAFGNARILAGGFDAWQQYALTPPAAPGPGASRAEVDDYLFRVALHQMLTGQKAAVAAVPIPSGAVAKPKKKGGGCSS